MTRYALTGIRTQPLASYLTGLGLLRVIAEQRDPACRGWWEQDVLHLETTVADLITWLVEDYAPTPVLSPWNEGSGFGAKDKAPKEALDALERRQADRFDGLRAALGPARQIAERARSERWDKARTVREYRNRCPDDLVAWVDATVVLADEQVFFPPLLGTGGNDGRLDFSTNYHQRLRDTVAVEGAALATSRRWASDLLHGTQAEKLRSGAVGQFDPAAAGGKNSSPHGDADSLVNPWGFVLLIEGSLLFAAGIARRLGHAAGSAAMPFTLRPSPYGAGTGAADEQSRGELWTPVWSRPFTYEELRQLFLEARASWRGRPARQAVQMYEAVMSHGVSRGIDHYVRYGLHQRNGLAFVAVPLDRVRVTPRPEVRLAAEVEDWPARFRRSRQSAAVEFAIRRFDAAHLQFARDGGLRRLAELLAALTDLEVAVGRSGRLRDELPVRRPARARGFIDVFFGETAEASAECRIAAGLASLRSAPGELRSRTLRELLLPIDLDDRGADWRDTSVVPGFGLRPLTRVLGDVLVWRMRHTGEEHTGDPELGTGSPVRGTRTFPFGLRVPVGDLHEWAAGRLDATELELWLRAFLALDWRETRWQLRREGDFIPLTTLALLHPFAEGLPTRQLAGRPVPRDVPRLALQPEWPGLLRADRTHEVHEATVRRLRQAGWAAFPPAATSVPGTALAAALLPRTAGALGLLGQVADTLVTNGEATETDAVLAGGDPSDRQDHRLLVERIVP